MPAINVLIVDDSPENAEVYTEFLHDDPAATYHIETAELAQDALDRLATFQPDVMLLDYLLPDMTGLEMVAQLHKQHSSLPYPIVMLTNMGSESVAVEALKMGVTDYVSKDQIDYDSLPRIVHTALEKHGRRIPDNRFQYHIINMLHAPGSATILQPLRNTPSLRMTTITDIQQLSSGDFNTANTIILTDYRLPDGQQAIPIIREYDRQLPIVVVSSTTTETEAVDAIKKGADDYLAMDSNRINGLREILLATLSDHQRELSEKNAEKQLKQQRNIVELFVEHSPAAVAMLDNHLRYIVVSRQWYLDYNLSDDDITGLHHYDVFPERFNDWRYIIDDCLQGEIHKSDATLIQHPDGHPDYIKWQIRPWFDVDGTIGGIIIFTEIITDEVKTRQKLAQSEIRYNQLVNHLPDTAVIMFDHEMRYTLAIGNLLEETGYNPDKMIGKTMQQILPLESQQVLLPAYQRVLAGEQFNVTRQFDIDFKTRIFESQFVPVFDFDGHVITGMIVVRDITQQHLAEAQIRESERRFRGIFNQTFQFVGLLTPDGILLEANDTALAFGGMKLEDIVDKPFQDTPWWSYSEALQKQLKGWIERAAQGEFIREEVRVKGGDGSFITIDFSLKPLIEDGEVVLLIPEGRDISERIRMEEELSEKYEEMDRFFTVAVDMLCIANTDGEFIRVNNAFERILGYTHEQLEGQSFMELIHPDDIQSTQDALGELNAQNPIWSFTNRYRTIKGEYRYLEWRSRPYGEFIYAAARDITERIETERELMRAIRYLQIANDEIQQFAHIVSHDLRAPLINLKGFISIIEKTRAGLITLEDAILPHLDDEQNAIWERSTGNRFTTAVNFIHNSIDKMDTYTTSMLKLARIGRREFSLEKIDPATVVESNIQTLATQIETGGIEIQVDDLPSVVTDRLALDQIFINLITNAIKYLHPERHGKIIISADIEPDRVIFDIQDNGRGIAQTDYDKVFAPFRRIGKQTTEGEGMGLAYVQALVRGLGGDIWFESDLDNGTTFSFSIPRGINS